MEKEQKENLSLSALSQENVSTRVVNAFLNKLAEDQNYTEVAERLREVLSNEKGSEKSIRLALFNEEEA